MTAYTEALRPAVTPLLAEDEELLLVTPVTTDGGTTEDVDVRDEVRNLAGVLLVAHPGELLRRATFGRAVRGPASATAARVHAAVDGRKGESASLALTGRRLLLLAVTTTAARGAVTYAVEPLLEVPRAALTGAGRRGVVLRQRVVLHFADGSSCALLVGLPSHARALVAAV